MAPGVEKVGAGGWSQLPLKHPGCVGESRCLPENPELLTKRRERRAGKLQTAMSLCRTVSGVPNPETEMGKKADEAVRRHQVQLPDFTDGKAKSQRGGWKSSQTLQQGMAELGSKLLLLRLFFPTLMHRWEREREEQAGWVFSEISGFSLFGG